MKMIRALAAPVLLGITVFLLNAFTGAPGWWTTGLVLLGFIIGYADPWDARGNRR